MQRQYVIGERVNSAKSACGAWWPNNRASDLLDAQVARPVAEQVLEILVPGRHPEGGAGEQVLDPGTAEIEREEGVQLVPRPGRVRLPVGTGDQGEQHCELPEQGGPAKASAAPRASRAT